MNPTIRTEAAKPAVELTLDELVALSLTAAELGVIASYQAFCGGSILTWAARLGRGGK